MNLMKCIKSTMKSEQEHIKSAMIFVNLIKYVKNEQSTFLMLLLFVCSVFSVFNCISLTFSILLVILISKFI